MNKPEIMRGMKMARKGADNRYVLREEYDTNTTVSSGVQIAIGDTQPVNKSFWLDTSDYASIQGATQTYGITLTDSDSAVTIGNTKPNKAGIFFDTSESE